MFSGVYIGRIKPSIDIKRRFEAYCYLLPKKRLQRIETSFFLLSNSHQSFDY
jgi:hypothetical protein